MREFSWRLGAQKTPFLFADAPVSRLRGRSGGMLTQDARWRGEASPRRATLDVQRGMFSGVSPSPPVQPLLLGPEPKRIRSASMRLGSASMRLGQSTMRLGQSMVRLG